MPDSPMPACRCGHSHTLHQHYRVNMTDDCAACDCPTYRRPPGRIRALIERWLG